MNGNSNKIDFTGLTNDQLVELVRSACAEAVSRGDATTAATQAAMLSEAEKAEIRRGAADAERARLLQAEIEAEATRAAAAVAADARKAGWARRRLLARMVREHLGDGWTLSAWSRDTDVRIYLDKAGTGGRRGTPDQKISFFKTGNKFNKPGALTASELGSPTAEWWKPVRCIVALAAEWYTDVRIDCSASLANDASFVELPFPADFEAAMEPIRAAREVERHEAEQAERERPAREARAKWGGWLVSARIVDQAEGAALLANETHQGIRKAPWPRLLTVAQDQHDSSVYHTRLHSEGLGSDEVPTPDAPAGPALTEHAAGVSEHIAALEKQISSEISRREQISKAETAARAAAEQQARRESRLAQLAARAANWPDAVILIRRGVVSPLHGVETPDLEPAAAALAVERGPEGLRVVALRSEGSRGYHYGPADEEPIAVAQRGRELTPWARPSDWPAEIQSLLNGDMDVLGRAAELPVIPAEQLNNLGDSRYPLTGAGSYYGGKDHTR